ncbi:MAG: VCBS domain-containing protein, partial [Pseudomonadota bacterium]
MGIFSRIGGLISGTKTAAPEPDPPGAELQLAQATTQNTESSSSSITLPPSISGAAVSQTYQSSAGTRITLPPGTRIDKVVVFEGNLFFVQPDGSVVVILDGATQVPTLLVQGAEIPAAALAETLQAAGENQIAAGPEAAESSGGNFAVPPGQIGPPLDLTPLLPPTALAFAIEINDPIAGLDEDDEIDSVPVIGTPEMVALEEDDLPEGNDEDESRPEFVMAMGDLDVRFGDDGPGYIRFSSTIEAPLDLASNGQQIVYQLFNNDTLLVGFSDLDGDGVFTGILPQEVADQLEGNQIPPSAGPSPDLPVFVIEISQDFGLNPTGKYTVWLLDSIDHDSTSTDGEGGSVANLPPTTDLTDEEFSQEFADQLNDEELAFLDFEFIAADGDGSTASSEFTVKIQDDIPVAKDDMDTADDTTVVSDGEEATLEVAIGNVITGAGTTGGLNGPGADMVGADEPGTITRIFQEDMTGPTNVPQDGSFSEWLELDHGKIRFDQDGNYQYEVLPIDLSDTMFHAFSFGNESYLNGDGTLDIANLMSDADATVSTIDNTESQWLDSDAQGVASFEESNSVRDRELGFRVNPPGPSNNETGTESLIVDLKQTVKSADVGIKLLFSGRFSEDEVGNWEAFNAAGESVGSGSFFGAEDGMTDVTIAPGEGFQYIVFTASQQFAASGDQGGDNSDFAIAEISAVPLRDDDDVVKYRLTDSDGDSSLATLTLKDGEGPDVIIPDPENPNGSGLSKLSLEVFEAALDQTQDAADLAAGNVVGTDPASPNETDTGTFKIAAGSDDVVALSFGDLSDIKVINADMNEVAGVVWGTNPAGQLEGKIGGETAIIIDLEDGSGNPITLPIAANTMQIVTVKATLTDAFPHSDPGNDQIMIQDLMIMVVDEDGDMDMAEVMVTVNDDVPEAADDMDMVVEGDGNTTSGNVFDGSNDDPEAINQGVFGLDDAGADGLRAISEITHDDVTYTLDLESDQVTSSAGNSFDYTAGVLTIQTELGGQLAINLTDESGPIGDYTYSAADQVPHISIEDGIAIDDPQLGFGLGTAALEALFDETMISAFSADGNAGEFSSKNVNFTLGGVQYKYSGLGVRRGGDNGELDFRPNSGSEKIVVDLKGPETTVYVGVGALFGGDNAAFDRPFTEQLQWIAKDDSGIVVGSGVVDGVPDGLARFEISGIGEFHSVELTALDDGAGNSGGNSDFLLQFVHGEHLDVLPEEFGYTIVDNDGDTANATLTIDVKDTVHVAKDDEDVVAEGQGNTATGNVVTGIDVPSGDSNEAPFDGTADMLGADTDGQAIYKVTHDGVEYTLANTDGNGKLTITTDLGGKLEIQMTGSEIGKYTYTAPDFVDHPTTVVDALTGDGFTVNAYNIDGSPGTASFSSAWGIGVQNIANDDGDSPAEFGNGAVPDQINHAPDFDDAFGDPGATVDPGSSEAIEIALDNHAGSFSFEYTRAIQGEGGGGDAGGEIGRWTAFDASGAEVGTGTFGQPVTETFGRGVGNISVGEDQLSGHVARVVFTALPYAAGTRGNDSSDYFIREFIATEPVHESFEYILTDGDWDTTAATLKIKIADGAPVAEPDTDMIMAGMPLDDASMNPAPATGNVITDAAPGDSGDMDNGADQTPGDPIEVVRVFRGNTEKDVDNDGTTINGKYGTLKIFSNGNYEYELDHTDPAVLALQIGDEAVDEFAYTIQDIDGNKASTTLTITVKGNNDGPQIEISSVDLDAVSEEGLPNGIADNVGSDDTTNADTAMGQITAVDPDGDVLTYTLGDPPSDLTSGGQPVVWTGENTDTLTGQVGMSTIITVTIDADGKILVDLDGPIDHDDASAEDDLSFDLTAYVSDGAKIATANVAVTIEDDSPTLTVTAAGDPNTLSQLALNADETDDAAGTDRYASGDTAEPAGMQNPDGNEGAPGLGTVSTMISAGSGGLLSLFAVAANAGADGEQLPRADDIRFIFTEGGPLATNLSATDGGAIALSLSADGQTITGLDQDTDPVFTIKIIDVGGEPQLELMLNEAIEHGNTALFDEVAELKLTGDGKVQLEREVTVVDGDNDSITQSDQIDLITSDATIFSFDDDGPKIIGDMVMGNVDETDITATSGQTNYVVNGSFEDTSDANATGFGFFGNLPGWSQNIPAEIVQ